MCGFVLELSASFNSNLKTDDENINLKRRGPDSYNSISKSNFVGEFFRLAIVSEVGVGEQPLELEGGKILFFNGEIYNWKDLTPVGQRFRSDTELLGFLINKFGFDAAIKKLDGMFAIACFDENSRRVHLARDYPGIKPLYFYTDSKRILISSDVNTIVERTSSELDEKMFPELLMFRNVLAPKTIYKDIYQCRPGSIMELQMDDHSVKSKSITYISAEMQFDNHEASVYDLEGYLEDAVVYQSKSIHTPFSLLSSGIDSGLIAKILLEKYGEVTAYSTYFNDDKYSEKKDIESDWNNQKIDIKFCLDSHDGNDQRVLRDYVNFKGSPVSVGNEVSLVKLFSEIKKSTSVVLSGEGADELFLGYDRTVKNLQSWFENGVEDRKIVQQFLTNYYYIPPHHHKSEAIFSDTVSELEEKLHLILQEYGWQKMYQFFFLNYHIPALLDRLDKTSMFASVEARVPFLSSGLIKYALSHSLGNPIMKCRKGNVGKALLRQIATKKISEDFGVRRKIGFPHPIYSGFSQKNPELGKNSWLYDQLEFFVSVKM